MQERIRAVMKYAGPRMPLKHPLMALQHALRKRKPVGEESRERETRERGDRTNRADKPASD
jgi:hypothetical protein